MEPYYYTKLNKQHQAVYHAMQQCLISLADEWQMPRVSGEALYNIFFQLRLDHPEIFWATGFKYRYYENSGNLIFLPEYLFEKAKIREHGIPCGEAGASGKIYVRAGKREICT